jgi:hypothetical protein
MHKSATKCNETLGKWCKNKHGASKIIDTLETYHLDAPFITDEIEKVFKEMPVDKALEPDGFNGLFVKKCWPLIKHDFINLVNDFYIGT